MWKALDLPKFPTKLSLKGSGAIYYKKSMLQRQSLTKYLRLTVALVSIFQELFARIDEIFFLPEMLATRMSFYEV